jgi:DNA-binding XRE family transcriptional regulator
LVQVPLAKEVRELLGLVRGLRSADCVRWSSSAPRRKRIRERAQAMLAELPLQELRQARRLTQEALAKRLGSNQALVSKLERRTDMYVSSLRGYIEGMGGRLEIIARFPDGAVKISQFHEIGPARSSARS